MQVSYWEGMTALIKLRVVWKVAVGIRALFDWRELACAGHRHSVRIVNGSLRRWVPLAVLALFAATEFAAQYLFIATPFAQAVGIPDSALRFIEVRAAPWSQDGKRAAAQLAPQH